MLKNYPMCKLALSISGVLLLSACGGGSDDSTSSTSGVDAYSYSSLKECADTDLDGVCSTYEQQISDTSTYSKMINDNGAILTAHAGSEMVSPFTTLVHSEMLFNPALKGDEESAITYLQKALGDKVGVNFSHVDTTHGPKQQTEVLLKTLLQAQSQGQFDPMLNIAHALDLMIANQTLDLSSINLKSQPSRHVSFDGLLTVHGSQVDSSLVGAKSISYNPANQKIVFLDSSDNVKHISIGNSNNAVSASARALSELTTITRYDDDDDDDDDDHHHGGSIDDLLGWQRGEHQLVQILPALNSIQSYKLYQPKLSAQASEQCGSTGTSGIFLTSLHDKSTQISKHSKVAIDAYGGASGSVPIPIPKPTPVNPDADLSAQRCFNDNFNWMMPLYQKKSIIAELDDGIYAKDKLRRLSADKLVMGSESYTLTTTQDFVVASLDESELLIVDSGAGGNDDAVLIDSTTLAPKSTIGINNAKAAAFTINDKLIFGLKDNNVTWVEKSQFATELNKFQLDAAIHFVKSSPNGKQSAVVTDSSLYLLDNSKYQVIEQFPIQGSAVKDLRVLNDKAVAVVGNSIEYFQFAKIAGPKLKVAAQLITNRLKDQWAATSSAHWKATNMGFLLEETGLEASVASKFDSINVNWLPTGVTQASSVTGVNISGLDRGTWITLYKPL
ncbi:hypothetical protein AKJ18_09565 [Vibrio xuii]|nr:hypothetical protein AKJ18_09565 [Vibrio xuii]